VSTSAELVAATWNRVPAIEINGELGDADDHARSGVRLTRDNVLEDVTIRTAEHEAWSTSALFRAWRLVAGYWDGGCDDAPIREGHPAGGGPADGGRGLH
jgi:hypothetical protein